MMGQRECVLGVMVAIKSDRIVRRIRVMCTGVVMLCSSSRTRSEGQVT